MPALLVFACSSVRPSVRPLVHPSVKGPAPFRFDEWSAKKKTPLLYMDVNLGFGKSGRIGIHDGDDPRALAVGFGRTYQLEPSRIGKLTDLILHHMQDNGIAVNQD